MAIKGLDSRFTSDGISKYEKVEAELFEEAEQFISAHNLNPIVLLPFRNVHRRFEDGGSGYNIPSTESFYRSENFKVILFNFLVNMYLTISI